MTLSFDHAETVLSGLKIAFPHLESSEQQIAFTGMVVVAAATSYELEIQKILFDFVDSKNDPTFSFFAREHWKHINGRISYSDLASNYLAFLGPYYKKHFKSLCESENSKLRIQNIDAINSYDQILRTRNSFIHQGMNGSINVTFDESLNDYEHGKLVIQWFSEIIAPVSSLTKTVDKI